MFYCDPPGSTDPNDLANYSNNNSVEFNYIFFHDQEPIHSDIHKELFDTVTEKSIDCLHNTFLTGNNTSMDDYINGMKPVRPHYRAIITSEKDSEYLHQLKEQYGWNSYYYFFHGWAALDWYRGYNHSFLITDPEKRNITKSFISPNRIIGGKRQHRVELMYHLLKRGIHNAWISFPDVCPAEGKHILDLAQEFIHYPDMKDTFSKANLPMSFPNEKNHPMHSCWLSLFDECAEALAYLVTETVATGRRHHLTEKTFKPICMQMPFVLVSTAGSLQYLRDYGFKTFDNIWDESYDAETNDSKRLEMIADLLKKLDQLSKNEKQDMFNLAIPIIKHNYEHFYNGAFEKILWEELQTMLSTIKQDFTPTITNFCYDSVVNGHGHPNLAKWTAQPYTKEWRQFDEHWPRTVPLRLLMYLDYADIKYGIHSVQSAPNGSWYPISFSWFDFDCNYIDMLSDTVKDRLRKKEIKLLCYYHEGDNPLRIRSRLGKLCWAANLPIDCFVFVSANSAAESIDQCMYFPDHEFFFRYVNRDQQPVEIDQARTYEFTALNRVHKWWRAAVMSDLLVRGLLDNSLWSYNCVGLPEDDYKDNPIEVDTYDELWRDRMHEFVVDGPHSCDQFNKHQQNNHHIVNTDLYTQSYFHIVIETHFDADQSGGTFITEKTWKPIKYGQPFVIIGPAGTLQALRESGYKVFDTVLDNSYDTIEDNTKRWIAVRKVIESIQQQGAANLYKKCQADIKWNQDRFINLRRVIPLNSLLEKLKCQI